MLLFNISMGICVGGFFILKSRSHHSSLLVSLLFFPNLDLLIYFQTTVAYLLFCRWPLTVQFNYMSNSPNI